MLCLVVGVQEFLAVELDGSGDLGGLGQQAHDGQRGDGLAAAGFAHQAHGFALADGEGDVVHDRDVAEAARETDGQVLHFQDVAGVGRDLREAVGALGFDGCQEFQFPVQQEVRVGDGQLHIGAGAADLV